MSNSIEQIVQNNLENQIKLGNLTEAEATTLKEKLGFLAFGLFRGIKSVVGNDLYKEIWEVDLPAALTKKAALAWMYYPTILNGSQREKINLTQKQIATGTKLLQQAEQSDLLVQTDLLVFFSDPLYQAFFCANYCRSQDFSRIITEINTAHFQPVWQMWASLDATLREHLKQLIKDNQLIKASTGVLFIEDVEIRNFLIEKLLERVANTTQNEKIRLDGLWYKGITPIINERMIEVFFNIVEDASEDEKVRKYLAQRIGRTSCREDIGKETNQAIISRLLAIFHKASDSFTQRIVVEGLGSSKTASEEVLYTLIKFMVDSVQVESKLKAAIVHTLGWLSTNDERVKQIAHTCLYDEDSSVRIEAVATFAKTDSLDVIEVLADRLKYERNGQVLWAILEMLSYSKLPLPKVAPELLDILPIFESKRTGESETEEMILDLIGRTHDPRAIESLLKFATDPKQTEEFRANCIQALGEIGNSKVIEPLHQFVSKKTDYFQLGLLRSLYKLGASQAYEALLKRYNEASTKKNLEYSICG